MKDKNILSARGKALRKARIAVEMSAAGLAERMGGMLSAAAIYAYESGRVMLSSERAVRIAGILGVEPKELLPDLMNAEESQSLTVAAESEKIRIASVTVTINGDGVNIKTTIPRGGLLQIMLDGKELHAIRIG